MKPELSSIQENKYRGRTEIRRQFLETIKGESRTKSDLFYSLRLSYPQIDEHAPWLVGNGLMTVKENVFTITEKGRRYLNALEKADGILREAQA